MADGFSLQPNRNILSVIFRQSSFWFIFSFPLIALCRLLAQSFTQMKRKYVNKAASIGSVYAKGRIDSDHTLLLTKRDYQVKWNVNDRPAAHWNPRHWNIETESQMERSLFWYMHTLWSPLDRTCSSSFDKRAFLAVNDENVANKCLCSFHFVAGHWK